MIAAVSAAVAAAMFVTGTPSGAHSIQYVKVQVGRLSSQEDQAIQSYDGAVQDFRTAKHQVRILQRKSRKLQELVAGALVAAYENGTLTNAGAMLTTSDSQAVMDQASALLEISASRGVLVRQYRAAEEAAVRGENAARQLQSQLLVHKRAIARTLHRKQALLASLTARQAAQAVTAEAGQGGTVSGVYSGPTATQGEKAVAFAFSKLGLPYLWGGTGPTGYDCSGLVQAAWAAAGVAIPRTTYEQVAALPAVSRSALEPGDLLFFDGDGHVGIYVGGGYLIDAPHTGAFIEKVPFAGWYSQSFVSAARP